MMHFFWRSMLNAFGYQHFIDHHSSAIFPLIRLRLAGASVFCFFFCLVVKIFLMFETHVNCNWLYLNSLCTLSPSWPLWETWSVTTYESVLLTCSFCLCVLSVSSCHTFMWCWHLSILFDGVARLYKSNSVLKEMLPLHDWSKAVLFLHWDWLNIVGKDAK